MTIASHNVAAPSPEAFACIATSLFCGAPGIQKKRACFSTGDREMSIAPRCRVLTHIEKRSYGKHGRVFTRGPAPLNPYTIQLSSVRRTFSFCPTKSGNHACLRTQALKTGDEKPVSCNQL